jgi:peroxiredoxin
MRKWLLICLTLFCTASLADTSAPEMTPMDGAQTAADFTLPSTDGTPFSLSDYKGKYVLVNFWAHWCGPCVKEFPAMQSLYDNLKDDNFEIVAIHAGPAQGRVMPFIEKHKITFKVVIDPAMSAHGWDVPVLPVSYLVSPEGKLIYKALGPREWHVEAMRALITD